MKRKHELTAVTLGLAVAGVTTLAATRARDVREIEHIVYALKRQDSSLAERFDPGMVAGLPEPARRYLLHAIQPGAPLARSVRLAMEGEMRLGASQPWLPFRARQVLAPPHGFVWDARVGKGIMRFAGGDSYANGRGRVAFRLWDLAPIVRAGGPDVDRSARGRLAIESIWQPASLLPQRSVTWTVVDERTARATVMIDGEASPLTLTIAPDGRLQSVMMERWGNQTADGQHAFIPFGADIVAERTFGGYTIPSDLTVSWWYGTDRRFDFFRAQVTEAGYLPVAE